MLSALSSQLQNLSQLNSSEILRAFQFVLRRNEIAPLAVVKVLVNQVDAEELETALEELNRMVKTSLGGGGGVLCMDPSKSVPSLLIWIGTAHLGLPQSSCPAPATREL